MKIYLDESPPGSGKTYRAINSIVDRKCKVIFAVEKIERFDELKDAISTQAKIAGSHPIIKAISSNAANRHGSVIKEISRAFDEFADNDHVIVLITHSALTSCNFENAHGWEIIIDEVPAMLDFEQKQTHLDLKFFEDHYCLQEIGSGWSYIVATEKGADLTVATLKTCESHKYLSQFHQRVLEASSEAGCRFVLCNLTGWNDMAQNGVQWCWASVFSFKKLASFQKITCLGNCFRSDVACKIAEELSGEAIDWQILPKLTDNRKFRQRDAAIRYFSESREASKSLFQSSTGQDLLREIGKYISAMSEPNSIIWSANDSDGGRLRNDFQAKTPKAALELGGMPSGAYLSPRQAGTNAHSSKSCAAMIYAAKPSPNILSLLDLLSIDHANWKASVEHETILQFMTRTSIRESESSSPLQFWVFDRAQADYLKASFDRLGYVNASVEFVENGPVIPLQSRPGPKAKVRTPAEQRAHDEEKRQRDATRKRLARQKARQIGQSAP